ncbi:hypothetical protein [Amycolatopsis sp. NPDC059021]|uniref:hypothetical protein n=1 Tax=Amycolatopsis sp. NPDC059021 TaxID=3346704 RepID=UPI00366BF671
MVEPITATYVQEDADWTITVSGHGKELTARAPGIIAARDRTDQLVEKLAPEGKSTVVHLLNGSALEFTTAYMTARLTLPEIAPLEVPPSATAPKQADAPAAEKTSGKPQLPPSKQLPKAVEDRKPEEQKTGDTKAKASAKAATPPAARA